MPDTTIVTNEIELKDAIANTLTPIIVANDIILTSMTTVNYEVEIQGDGMVALIWNGTAITNRNMFSVQSAGFLKIENLILDGGEKDVTLINMVSGQGSMDERSILRNLKSTSANGAVKLNGGIFTMDGGLITGVDTSEAVQCVSGTLIMQKNAQIVNTVGAGISLYLADFQMSGQSRIADNKSTQAGGGILCVQSTITMGLNEGDSPSIENNESPYYSGAIYLSTQSILTMRYNSRISGNKAVTFASGIGMGQNSQLLMYDNSSITGHEGTVGSGLWANDSVIKMFDSSSISDNVSSGVGGGVYLQDGTSFEMQGTSKVTGNRGDNGGGIYIKNSTATIGVNNEDAPEITNNISSGNGGGIFIDSDSTLTLAANVLIANNESLEGVGVYKDGILNLSGSPKINSLFFDDITVEPGSIVQSDNVPVIVGALTEEAEIFLEASTYISSSNVPLVIAEKGDSYIELTQTDSNAFIIPISFGEGYYTRLNESNDQVLIDTETYDITYTDLFGATNPNPIIYTVLDLPITLLDPGERCGYIFIGWFNNEDTQITEIPEGTAEDIYLTAKWKNSLPEYILTFDGNAGNVTNIPDSVLSEEGASIAISSQIPLKEDHLFISWNTAPDGIGDTYQPADTLVITNLRTRLYAQWQNILAEGIVTFDSNAPNVTNVPDSVVEEEMASIVISSQIPLKNDYWFVGWNTLSDGSGDTYQPLNTLVITNPHVRLYAQWEQNPNLIHTLSFTGNAIDSTNVPEAIDCLVYDLITIPTTIPLRDKYSFLNWNTKSDGSGDIYNPGDVFMMPTSDVILYAIWQTTPIPSYSVFFDGNVEGAANVPANIKANETDTVVLPTIIPTHKNLIFKEWNTIADGSGDAYSPGSIMVMPHHNIILYAQWTFLAQVYSLYFLGNTSEVCNLPNTITALQGSSVTIPQTIPLKKGYSFLNWNTEANGTGVTYKPHQTLIMPSSNLNLYAIWQVTPFKTHTISFNGNSNNVSNLPSKITTVPGDTVMIPLTTPTRCLGSNCSFSGWNTASDGNGIPYMPGQIIIMPNVDLVLYAQWSSNVFNVLFKTNDNSDPSTKDIPTTMILISGQILRIPSTIPRRYGYKFIGWKTSIGNRCRIFKPCAVVGRISQNMTFLAQWVAC